MNDVLNRATYQYSRLTASEQIDLASNVIASGALGAIGGTYVAQLEEKVAKLIGRGHAIGVASATAGLEVALRTLGARPGRQVIIPELSWVSVGAAATATGAEVTIAPVSYDVAPGWEEIEPLLRAETCAVVLAHMRGMPAPDIVRVAEELERRGVPLVEDCAQAWGVTAAGRPVGAYGATAVLSTQSYKLIATGEGGAILTDDHELAGTMRALAGDTRTPTPAPVWRGNARMSEITAALALPQLQNLDNVIERLRPLQQRVAMLLRERPGVQMALPHPRCSRETNGTHAGAWYATAVQAEQHAARLSAAGLRCWHPGSGDLHTAEAWPVRPAHAESTRRPDLRRYLDIQIPLLQPTDHDQFCHLIAQVLEPQP